MLQSINKFIINTDGGSRGNPGPAAIGVVIVDENEKVIHEISEKIGDTTNNVAEYSAVLAAVEFLTTLSPLPTTIEFRLDSELVVSQLTGKYKIKDEKLKTLASKINSTLPSLNTKFSFIHVRREFNKRADELVNIALDKI